MTKQAGEKNYRALEKLTLLSAFLSAALMPFSTTYANLALALLLLTSVISFFCYGINTELLRAKEIYLFSPFVLFIPVLIGFFYSSYNVEAFKDLKRLIFIPALTLVILRKDIPFKRLWIYTKKGLIIGCTLSAALLLSVCVYRVSQLDQINFHTVFSYDLTNLNFVAPLSIHPIYLGSYYLMAMVFIIDKLEGFKRSLKYLLSLLLLLSVLFLNSRIIFGLTIIIFCIYIVRFLSWKVLFILVVMSTVGVILLLPKLDKTYIYDRIAVGLKWDLTQNVGTYSTDKEYKRDSRMSRWNVAVDLFKKQPVFGSGAGTERSRLEEEYLKRNMTESYQFQFNAHNQFLSYLVKYGIFGSAFLLLYFIVNFYKAIKERDLSFVSFLIIMMGIFLVENYISRNLGIIFMGFFGALFFYRLFIEGDNSFQTN